MVDPGLVLFAIQAGVKLGRKTYDVLVDSTQATPLSLPLGTLAGSIKEAEAIEFFDRRENRPLLEVGGPYQGFAGARLVAAYYTVGHLGTRLGDEAGATGEAVATLRALHQFEQHKAGFGPRSPWQRIAGTIVEVGIDYFVANPQAMGKDSAARHTVEAFLLGIKDIDFAEGDPLDIVGDTLLAGLKVLGDNATLVSNDTRVQVLLGGVTASLRDELRAAGSLGQLQRREALFKRITASILRGGATAVAGNADLFIQGDDKAKAMVRSTVTEMLAGIRDREDSFSTETLEGLFRTALTAVAANSELFVDRKLVQEVLRSTVTALTAGPGGTLFSGTGVEAIARAALKTVGDHAGTLVDPAHPERQVVADAVAAIAHGLASELAGGAPIKQLLSTNQVVDLTQSVLLLVARHPERLVGGDGGDPRRTMIAQVLGSVASALAQDRNRLVNGDTFVELGRTALAVALKNRDKLLDLDSADPRTNLLYKTLNALAGTVLAGGDARRLVDRDVFLGTARRVLLVVSADVGPVIQSEGRVVGDAVRAALQLSTGTLQNQINGDNLPALIEGLLRAALAREVALNDAAATASAAAAILRTAA